MYINKYISHEAATISYNIFFEAVLFLFCLASIRLCVPLFVSF